MRPRRADIDRLHHFDRATLTGRQILLCILDLSNLTEEQFYDMAPGKRFLQWPRHLAMYMMVKHCPWLSMDRIAFIARYKSGRSARHVTERIEQKMATDPDLKELHDRACLRLGLVGKLKLKAVK